MAEELQSAATDVPRENLLPLVRMVEPDRVDEEVMIVVHAAVLLEMEQSRRRSPVMLRSIPQVQDSGSEDARLHGASSLESFGRGRRSAARRCAVQGS
jgi:hypothetical protein